MKEFDPASGYQKAFTVSIGTIFIPMFSIFVVSTSATSEEDTISGSEITSYCMPSAVFAFKHIIKSYLASHIPFAPPEYFIKDCIASSVTYTAFTIIQKK